MKLTLTLQVLATTTAMLTAADLLAFCWGEEPVPEDCGNGVDDDGDLGIDCADTECYGGTDVLISEIMTDPTRIPDVDGEYVELLNYGTRCVDLSRWTIAEDSGFPPTVLPGGAVLKPGARFAVAGTFYPSDNCGVSAGAVWQYDSTLNNDTDILDIKDPNGVSVIRVGYCNGVSDVDCLGDWPSCPPGAALEYCGPLAGANNTDGGYWQCATAVYGCGDKGTPKAANTCGG